MESALTKNPRTNSFRFCMNDGDIGIDRRDGGESFSCEWAFDEFDFVVVIGQVGTGIGANDGERKVGRSGDVSVG